MDMQVFFLLFVFFPCYCAGDCYEKYTSFTYDGKGNTVYLDRQNDINCNPQGYGIKQFHLARHPDHQHVQYGITCCKVTNDERCDTLNNDYTDDGDGNVVYLDRQWVTCPFNGYLKYFYLNRSGNHQLLRYTYTCCISREHTSDTDCYNDNTPGNDDGDGNMVYLDRHRPECRPGYYLNRFHLIRPTSSTIRYDFRCCRYTTAK